MRFASSGQGDLVTSGFAGAWLRAQPGRLGDGSWAALKIARGGKGPRKGPRWKE
jgi:hypothetical protein